MFYHFVDDEQFNFQMNRIASYKTAINLDELWDIAPKLKDLSSWTTEWFDLAQRAENEGRFLSATYYYRLAEFYMVDESSEKLKCYQHFMDCFHKAYKSEALDYYKIPFEETYLPAYKLKAENEKGIIVAHGGYDSFIEEFFPIINDFPKNGYTVIMFEGPGQGQARKNNLTFCYDWEIPTSAILDYFHLDQVTLLGISWGGYLAPRAAAFDKRIKNVICYDIFYKGLDVFANRMPDDVFNKLMILLKTHQKLILNKVLNEKMKGNIDLTWKIKHGMYITGTNSPYDFLKSVQQHDLSKITDKITQNILLLAGENDQYVPVARLEQIKAELVNAKSVTAKIFTKVEGGDQHCQVGNIEAALNTMYDFLDKVEKTEA
jgi:pimeloyl-ACP methyl ester carboxylesterase